MCRAIMDPVVNLPSGRWGRESKLNLSLCLICQTRTRCELRNASETWIQRLKKTLKYNDIDNISITDRLQTLNPEETTGIKWHKGCYSSFNNPDHIKRLQARFQSRKSNQSTPSSSGTIEPGCSSKSKLFPIDWIWCMFCQSSRKDKLQNVEFLQTSARILQLSIHDHAMRIRLAGMTDLVASKGKCHLICYR